jgi:hypothetical protein
MYKQPEKTHRLFNPKKSNQYNKLYSKVQSKDIHKMQLYRNHLIRKRELLWNDPNFRESIKICVLYLTVVDPFDWKKNLTKTDRSDYPSESSVELYEGLFKSDFNYNNTNFPIELELFLEEVVGKILSHKSLYLFNKIVRDCDLKKEREIIVWKLDQVKRAKKEIEKAKNLLFGRKKKIRKLTEFIKNCEGYIKTVNHKLKKIEPSVKMLKKSIKISAKIKRLEFYIIIAKQKRNDEKN